MQFNSISAVFLRFAILHFSKEKNYHQGKWQMEFPFSGKSEFKTGVLG